MAFNHRIRVRVPAFLPMTTVKDLIRTISYTVTALEELQRVCIDTEEQFLKLQIFLFVSGIQAQVEGYLEEVVEIIE